MALDSGQMAIHSGEKDLALGLDPGRDKTGFAFVNLDGGLLVSGIFSSHERENFFAEIERAIPNLSSWIQEGSTESLPEDLIHHLRVIIIGNGTTSREFSSWVENRASCYKCDIMLVDERNTTLEARSLYWKIHRPGLISRLIPEGLRVPKRVLDDLAAWAVALRGVKEYRDIFQNKL